MLLNSFCIPAVRQYQKHTKVCREGKLQINVVHVAECRNYGQNIYELFPKIYKMIRHSERTNARFVYQYVYQSNLPCWHMKEK